MISFTEIAELKALSTSTWGSGKRAFGAMPAAIERAIKKQSGRIGPKLHHRRALMSALGGQADIQPESRK